MNVLVISTQSKKTFESVKEYAKKLDAEVSVLSKSDIEEIEDARMLKRIKAGAESGMASRARVLKKLRG
ncbi:MAG: hypothetical protein WCO63_01160 [Bacteroidota bacterium]